MFFSFFVIFCFQMIGVADLHPSVFGYMECILHCTVLYFNAMHFCCLNDVPFMLNLDVSPDCAVSK